MSDIKSKEAILRKHYSSFDIESGWMFDGAVEDVFKAMDEFGEQCFIAAREAIIKDKELQYRYHTIQDYINFKKQ